MKNIILFFALIFYLQAADLTGRDVMTKMVTSDNVITTQMNIKLTHTEVRRGKEKIKIRELVRYHKRYKAGNYISKSLMRFSKPDIIKGTGFLIWAKTAGGNDQWLFLPKVKSARKIEAQDKTKSFMNTEFSYEDLESFNQPDEQYFLEGKEVLDNLNCYIVEVIGHANTQYKRSLAWIDDKEWQLRKVEFYDKNNKLIKVLIVSDYQTIDGFSFTTKMTMENVQTGSHTVMDISNIKFNIDIADSYFTKNSLVNP